MRNTILCTSAVLLSGLAAAQSQNEPPPPVIRAYVEQVKPGKSAAHEKTESGFARAFAKANYPAHYVALNSMSGADEVWFVEGHDSFAGVEKSEKASDQPALKAELQQASALDGEYLASSRSLIGVYRPDLSYHAEEGMAAFAKMRYVNVITIRLKMGSDQRLVGDVAEMVKIYNNIQVQQPVMVYQVISGAPSGTMLMFEPVASLAEWDKYPAMMQALKQAGGRKFDAIEKDFADITLFEEGRLMSVSPKMSYVPKEVAAGDPEFWMPKPMVAAKPAAKAGAAKKTEP